MNTEGNICYSIKYLLSLLESQIELNISEEVIYQVTVI